MENELHFTGENIDGLEAVIYTTQGVLLKKETISNNMIHVEELQTGTYLIKIEEFGSTLFIKR